MFSVFFFPLGNCANILGQDGPRPLAISSGVLHCTVAILHMREGDLCEVMEEILPYYYSSWSSYESLVRMSLAPAMQALGMFGGMDVSDIPLQCHCPHASVCGMDKISSLVYC